LRQALEQFLAAFRNLDSNSFIAAFAAEATVFFPFADQPRRANGIDEIAAVFTPFFESLRSRHPGGPPYLQLDPADLRITISGKLALASFHLHDSAEGRPILCRRSMVWADGGTRWRIVHLHASNLPTQGAL